MSNSTPPTPPADEQAREQAKAALKAGGYVEVIEGTYPNSSTGFLDARTPEGLKVRVRYDGRKEPWCTLQEYSSDPSLVLIGPGIPSVSQARMLVRQCAESLPVSVDLVRNQSWTVKKVVFGGEWSLEIQSSAEVGGREVIYVLHPEHDEWHHYVRGAEVRSGLQWNISPGKILDPKEALDALIEAEDSGALTQNSLEDLRQGARQALREAGEEIRTAEWSVAVETSTMALVGVSGVSMGREMLELELRVQNWGEKDLLCQIKGFFPDTSVPNNGGLPEPREFVGGEEGVTVRRSEHGIPTPRQAARLLLMKEEHDTGD